MRLNYLQVLLFILLTTVLAHVPQAAAQGTEETPATNVLSAAKFAPIPDAPQCFTITVEHGNPATGPSVLLAKFTPGCIAPWHWHTPSETAMVVSGSLEAQMKGDKTLVAHAGDFVYLPPHHVHRATCRGSVPCLLFLSSDARFDIHWVDAAGQEISLDEALKNVKLAVTSHSREP